MLVDYIIVISLVWILTIVLAFAIAIHSENKFNGGVFSRINIIVFLAPFINIIMMSIYAFLAYRRTYSKVPQVDYKQKYNRLMEVLIQQQILTREQINDLIDSRNVFEKLY